MSRTLRSQTFRKGDHRLCKTHNERKALHAFLSDIDLPTGKVNRVKSRTNHLISSRKARVAALRELR